jgi:hypothetical protein
LGERSETAFCGQKIQEVASATSLDCTITQAKRNIPTSSNPPTSHVRRFEEMLGLFYLVKPMTVETRRIVKYREIIADNLSKAGWSWAVCQPWTPTGKRSGLLTRIAATESVSLCTRMKS